MGRTLDGSSRSRACWRTGGCAVTISGWERLRPTRGCRGLRGARLWRLAGSTCRVEAALVVEEFPDALDGLGRALWWLRDSEQAVVYRERAYSGFSPRRAAGAGGADRALALARVRARASGRRTATTAWSGFSLRPPGTALRSVSAVVAWTRVGWTWARLSRGRAVRASASSRTRRSGRTRSSASRFARAAGRRPRRGPEPPPRPSVAGSAVPASGWPGRRGRLPR